jgi:hypothetical protein
MDEQGGFVQLNPQNLEEYSGKDEKTGIGRIEN